VIAHDWHRQHREVLLLLSLLLLHGRLLLSQLCSLLFNLIVCSSIAFISRSLYILS
jgi:hypothetical protein